MTYDVFEAIFVILNYLSVHVNYELGNMGFKIRVCVLLLSNCNCNLERKVRIKRSFFFNLHEKFTNFMHSEGFERLVRTWQGGFLINIQCDY